MSVKRFFNVFTVVCAAAALVIGVTGCSKDTANKVVIKGSTTVLPITQKAAEAFKSVNPKIRISVSGSGSGDGIKSIIEGTCDIANSSREMKPEEIASAQKINVKIKEILVAYDMIVPVVHPSNPVKNLTMDQLKGIYDGTITNWKQVGGKDETIVVVSRDTSSGTYEIWEKKVMKKAKVRQDALLQASNGAIVGVISQNPKAIGYIGFGYINQSVSALSVNSIVGTIENGKSGKFPISRKLYMYVNEGKYSADTQAFVEYLVSPIGQDLVKQAGFIPLN